MTGEDHRYMREALVLAARARGRTAPNPMVGAVVVREGRVVGRGWHRRAGEPHAEVEALAMAGEAARGGTLYVTLEPCCHHGRTPPCVDAVLASGVRRVVAAMSDPFPHVAGGGLRRLRNAGVQVECGLSERAARELNRGYLKALEKGLPWVTLKIAMTLDGRIATRTGDSRWVTGEPARRHVHWLRSCSGAVLIGIGTARADNPRLTARLRGARSPLRVVVDARAELEPHAILAQTARETPTLLAAGEQADTSALELLGVEVERMPLVRGRVELRELLRRLAARGVHDVLCEGGAGLAGSLLDEDLVDEVAWFISPRLAGGQDALAAVAGDGVARMEEAKTLAGVRVRRMGDDLAVFGYLHQP